MVLLMAKDTFRQHDLARVQEAFDNALHSPYYAQIALTFGATTMQISVMDPDDAKLTIASGSFEYMPEALWPPGVILVQPNPAELARVVDAFVHICATYPAQKKADADAAMVHATAAQIRDANIAIDEAELAIAENIQAVEEALPVVQ